MAARREHGPLSTGRKKFAHVMINTSGLADTVQKWWDGSKIECEMSLN